IQLGIIPTAVFLKHSDIPVFLYIINTSGLFTTGIDTMYLLGILWKNTTHANALTSGILTIHISIGMEMWFPEIPSYNSTGIVFWVCMGLCMVVSLLTKPKDGKDLDGLIWTRESLKLPAVELIHSRGIRNPLLWWGIITAIVLFFYIRFA